jgi:aminomethyltransferase
MSSSLLHTPLYDAHVTAGARMVDFGGWEMPIHYGSQIDEHHAVRKQVGMFDVSHMCVVDVSGPDAKTFLQSVLSNDVVQLKHPIQALYSCMLNPEGGIIDDLIVYYQSDEQWRLVVNAACASKDLAWLNRVAQHMQVTVQIEPRRDLAILAVQGPQAQNALLAVRPTWHDALQDLTAFRAQVIDDVFVACTGYTGEAGYEIILPADEVASLWHDLLAYGVKPCGLGARDTLRLEAGMNLYGQDMNDLILPSQAGLSWSVSLKNTERQFIGRQALEQWPVSGKLVGLQLLERGVMRAHMSVLTAHGKGEITSGTMSPTLGYSIAFARLPDAVALGDQVQVDIRGKQVLARVCKRLFVRHGQAVINP